MIQVVSFVNKTNSGSLNFQKSFHRFRGWNVEIIGRDAVWEGWITRMQYYRDYAERSDPDQLLVFLDAFDLLCISDADGFKGKFERMRTKYVCGYEKYCSFTNCRPPRRWQKIHGCFDMFVNGGCVIGRARDIAYMWGWCISKGYTKDDQIALNHFMDAHPQDVSLDLHHEFVYNDNSGASDLTVSDDGVLLDQKIRLNCYFIHFPGLMIYRSIIVNPDFGKTPENYCRIAQYLLNDDALTEFPINYTIFRYNVLGIIFIVGILLSLLIVFMILYILCRQKTKRKTDI